MNNVVLGVDSINKAMSDSSFFKSMPEFASLRTKLDTIKNSSPKHGCNTCRERRIKSGMFGDFVSILNTLSTASMNRFKKYLGADTLMVNAYDASSGKTVLKRF